MIPQTTHTHYRTCNLCEAMCGLAIDMHEQRIVAIRGDAADPFSKGHICPKATALQDVYADPDRLKTPMRRTVHGWQAIGWAEAINEVASKLRQTQAAHGNNAVGVYLGNPNVHNVGSMLFSASIIKALRSQNIFSATSVDQLPHQFVARHMFGHQFLLPIPDVERTDYFLILGANPMASNGSLMTAGGIERHLKGIKHRGGKIVLIDPRRSETADVANEHIFIKPNSDVLLLLAMLHTIFAEGLAKPDRLAEFCNGWDAVRASVAAYSPHVVSAATGIAAETILRLAREFAAAPRAVCYGRVGLSMQRFGGLCQWLINLLNIVTGNLDRAGGAMFTTPAIDMVDGARAGKFGRWRSRVRGLPEFAGELPVATLAEEILTAGDGQIRAMVTVAGNPVLSTPNGGQLDTALASLDFMVAIDIYINETTRHAHIILPPTAGLECEHYDIIFHVLAIHNSAKYSPPLFAAAPDQRHDWQIYQALVQALGGSPVDEAMSSAKSMTPAQLLDLGLRYGPYGASGLSLDKLKAEPHGVDLGPLQPRLPERLFTPDKRIQLAPDLFLNDLARVQAVFKISEVSEPSEASKTSEGYDLMLIGRRHLRSNNSWMHNSERLVRGKDRCTVLMHPHDAATRGLHPQQTVTIKSRVGQVSLPLEISDDVMLGVGSVPHGWGHDRAGTRLQVAQRQAGVSINDLTDEVFLDDLTGNAAFSGVQVSVTGL
ncbi:MAG: molybdopterin-dependent oxidoreductase [Anaerolineae bacterium]|nr:molybdopterin-dependent oxidoreductase [Anaerolineae bacterium]